MLINISLVYIHDVTNILQQMSLVSLLDSSPAIEMSKIQPKHFCTDVGVLHSCSVSNIYCLLLIHKNL